MADYLVRSTISCGQFVWSIFARTRICPIPGDDHPVANREFPGLSIRFDPLFDYIVLPLVRCGNEVVLGMRQVLDVCLNLKSTSSIGNGQER